MTHYEGDLRAPAKARFVIIASRWNPRITDTLVAGARKAFEANGVEEHALDVVRVPGARRRRPPAGPGPGVAGGGGAWPASPAATPATTSRSPTAAARA